MKIIIELPEYVKSDFDNANIADVDCYVNDHDSLIGNAIKYGVVVTERQEVTNGDMIKTMFPKMKFEQYGGIITTLVGNARYTFLLDWWNAPYEV